MNERSIDLLLPEVTIDELIEAAHKMMETLNIFGTSITEAATLFRESFMKAFGYFEEEGPKTGALIRPGKKRGASFRKCFQQPTVHYSYIPIAPRNLPYQRRTY